MKQITERRALELAAAAWRPGTKMQTIIVDGWSRGFHKSQTLHECIQAGYSKCIAEPAIDKRWKQMDDEYAKHNAAYVEARAVAGEKMDAMVDDLFDRSDWPAEKLPLSQDKRSPEDKAVAIARYETYWKRCFAKSRHHIDCPNEACDHKLKIARPERGSGEMWDSLATCPYCNGTFFYESRPLRIDVAFKGFI